MKLIPILYSSAMVQAKLARRETQTRRIMKTQPQPEHKELSFHKGKLYRKGGSIPTWYETGIKCPYGQPGDILWGRENFRINGWSPDDGEIDFYYEADGKTSGMIGFDEDELFNRYWIQSCTDLDKAGYVIDENECYSEYDVKHLRLRPSIHMPQFLCRIFDKIISIKVERLNDITPADAKAEGIIPIEAFGQMLGWQDYINADGIIEKATDSYKSLWEKINGSGSWEENPWVWVIETQQIEKPEILFNEQKRN